VTLSARGRRSLVIVEKDHAFEILMAFVRLAKPFAGELRYLSHVPGGIHRGSP
jgi:hypothetical protein